MALNLLRNQMMISECYFETNLGNGGFYMFYAEARELYANVHTQARKVVNDFQKMSADPYLNDMDNEVDDSTITQKVDLGILEIPVLIWNRRPIMPNHHSVILSDSEGSVRRICNRIFTNIFQHTGHRISIRIVLWSVHIAFSVMRVIQSPVIYSSSGNTVREFIRMSHHKH